MSEEQETESVELDRETAEILRRMAQRSGRPLSKLTQDLCELYAKQNDWDLSWEQGEPHESEREQLWTKWSSMPDKERRHAFQLMTLGANQLNELESLWSAWQGQTSEVEKSLLLLMKGGVELRAVLRLLSLDDTQFDAVNSLLQEPDTIHDIITPTDETASSAEEKQAAKTCVSCVHYFPGPPHVCRRLPPVSEIADDAEYPRVRHDTPRCGEHRFDTTLVELRKKS